MASVLRDKKVGLALRAVSVAFIALEIEKPKRQRKKKWG